MGKDTSVVNEVEPSSQVPEQGIPSVQGKRKMPVAVKNTIIVVSVLMMVPVLALAGLTSAGTAYWDYQSNEHGWGSQEQGEELFNIVTVGTAEEGAKPWFSDGSLGPGLNTNNPSPPHATMTLMDDDWEQVVANLNASERWQPDAVCTSKSTQCTFHDTQTKSTVTMWTDYPLATVCDWTADDPKTTFPEGVYSTEDLGEPVCGPDPKWEGKFYMFADLYQ